MGGGKEATVKQRRSNGLLGPSGYNAEMIGKSARDRREGAEDHERGAVNLSLNKEAGMINEEKVLKKERPGERRNARAGELTQVGTPCTNSQNYGEIRKRNAERGEKSTVRADREKVSPPRRFQRANSVTQKGEDRGLQRFWNWEI